ncbi:MAG: DUF3152 domain-containing protein [Bifidobacteriaceae bacterium]|jgi:hypothetical protein|nr:DUF3152 domain-containing protein [Bifidobacteriaceae bacterium]
MSTYQTRRKARLTPLGKVVFVGLALAALMVVWAVGKAVQGRIGEFGARAEEPTPPAEQIGSSRTEAEAEQGVHPDAAVVVTYDVSAAGPIDVSLADFARQAQEALNDPAGWRSAGVGFDRVAEGGDFTLWMATADQLPRFAEDCSPEYSCRVGRDVVINQDRWLHGALPGALDGLDIGVYRAMVVNHEVGHWLGHDHTGCPGPGQEAPLMMQQSKGLDGCTANQYPLPEEQTAPSLGLG